METLQDILKFDPNARIKHLKKGEILQHAGDLQAHTYCVTRGLLRSYIIDSKAKEHIYTFAPEGWLIGDIESMEFDHPLELYIDCVEDSEVILFDRDCLFKANLNKEDIINNARLLYRRMGILQRRVLMLMSSPALDRYIYFVETYPELVQRVPQHMIATFLGITPQALSTLRGKMVRSE